MPKKTLYLLDAHALCYRAFYAIRELQNSKGQPTNAIFGFVNTLKKIIKDFNPSHMAVCFDSKGKTLREQKYDKYKIQRPSMPEDLSSQIPFIKEVIQAFNIHILEQKGLEADDLIAALAKWGQDNDIHVVIVSDDKDMYQLAGAKTTFFSPRKDETLDRTKLKDKLGFDPVYMADYLALAGDSADNIPGVKGVGKVSAAKLINEFGSLEEIIEHVDSIKPEKLREKISAQRDNAVLSKELALLDGNIDLTININELNIDKPDSGRLFELFKEFEFRRLADEYGGGIQEVEDIDLDITAVDSKSGIKEMLAYLKKNKEFSLHWEEDEKSSEVTGAVFAAGKTRVFTLDPQLMPETTGLFDDPNLSLTAFNLKKTLKILKTYGIVVHNQVFDCLLAGYLLGIPHSRLKISDLAWEFLKTNISHSNTAAVEAKTALDLKQTLLDQLKTCRLTDLLDDIEIPLTRVLFNMEEDGVALDIALLKSLSKTCQKQINTLSGKLYDMAGGEFNLNSPKQLSVILFEKMGLPPVKKTKTGFSTNEEVLNILAKNHEFPGLILEYRQLAKLKSTYIDALPKLVDGTTGRIHAVFDQAGTETGRLSSRQPNLQNIPIRTELGRKIRKAIIADKGNILIAADYSQIELRILAHLSGDEGLKTAFSQDQDIHGYTASLIFDTDINDIDYGKRDTAKRVNFGIIYGMSAFGLAKDLHIPQPQAQEFIDKYFLRYPAVQTFMQNCIKECREKGYVTTLLNRRRYIPDVNSRNNAVRQYAERQAINTPVQGSAADLMKLAMIRLDEELSKERLSSRMVMTVHDELVLDVPEDEVKKASALLKQVMEHTLELSVPIKVTVKKGLNWLEMEEV